MMKFHIIVIIALLLVASEVFSNDQDDNNIDETKDQNARKKRLLFYDEEGNLVKTFTNPYLRDFILRPETYPFFGNFFKPFQSLLQLSNYGHPVPYMIPISEDVVQQINRDPIYQNKLLFMPTKEMNVQANSMCFGKRTQIPSPNSCNRFLNCWDGWAFEQECPADLLFSSEGFCDYPNRVNCGSRRVNDDVTSTQKCSKDFDVFRNEAKCGEFFVCVDQLPIRFKCPADLFFNEVFGICDYPYRVDCNAALSLKPMDPPAPLPNMDPSIAPAANTSATTSDDDSSTKMNANAQYDSGNAPTAMSLHDAVRQVKLSRYASLNVA